METIENLIVELTTLCNLKCIHCGYGLIDSHQKIDKNYLISIIIQLLDRGLQQVMFTGGEPTLYHDLPELVRFCKKNKLYVKIATNGSKLESIDSLINEDLLDEIVISVDAVFPETYRSIRGKDGLLHIYQFIEQHYQIANKIHLSFLVQRKNYKEIIPFLERSKSLNVAKIALLAPHYDSDFTSTLEKNHYRDNMFPNDEEAIEIHSLIAPQVKCFYMNNTPLFKCSSKHIDALMEYICNPDTSYNFRNSICSFPLKSLFLYSDGSVSLCPYYPSWKMTWESLYDNIRLHRMKCILKGKEKNGYCRRCLEVPL